MCDKHIQEQPDILTHRKVGRPDLGTNLERVLEGLKVSLERRLDGREGGFQTEGKWEGVPYMWALGRERAWVEGGEFGARGVQAATVGG